MMYAKLALRNIRRSLRDYIIYFVTLMLTASLMIAFLALGFSSDILAMTENMSMLTHGILILSMLIAFISSFIVGYAIRFMLNQRKKEFAIYELMGMEVKTVRNLFLLENGVIGGAAFLLGTLIGTGLSGVLNQLVQNIFEIPHRYQILFSFRAWMVTLFFFVLMFGFGMLRAAKIIRRQRIIDLLYDSKKNEPLGRFSLNRGILTCLFALVTMAIGVLLLKKGLHIQTNKALLYGIGACLMILASVYKLHLHLPLLLHQFAKQKPHWKYRKETLFSLGQIGRRVQSSGRTMAVVSILLTLSLTTMFIGLTMGAGYKANMEAYYPYDVGVAIDAPLTKDSMDAVYSYVEEQCKIEDSVTYYLYAVPNEAIEALTLSDYNHLRTILGLSPVSMNDNEFLVHCDTWNYMEGIQQGLAQQPNITLNGQTLTPAETPILTEPMEQYRMAGTKGYVLVLPDKVAFQLPGEKIRLVMRLTNGGYPELKNELKQFLNSSNWQPCLQSGQKLPSKVTLGVTVKAWGVANSLTGFTTISFCGLYLSIIFIILSCSVLAFEQLSAIDQNKKNYAIIDRLGIPRQAQCSLMRKELSAVFMIPLFFPVLLTILLMIGTQVFFGEAILQDHLIPLYGSITLLIFFTIYAIYYGATLFLFKRIILLSKVPH